MAVAEIAEAGQYLTFQLNEEVFSVDISKVREVLEFTTITKVPRMPEYIRGAINLRDSVVPVIDLRIKFGMAMTEKTINTCIIIVEVDVGGGIASGERNKMVTGVLVDAVQEVMDIESKDIEPAPGIGIGLKTEFIKGMGKHGDHFIIILDIDKVFSSMDILGIQGTGGVESSEDTEV
ncbi:MAG: purine-binding chemotaxis protein CheW [Nitrospirae bacterium]|nr:purine-binding chemotaxis protein CheW [Nitrospirota bacterium]